MTKATVLESEPQGKHTAEEWRHDMIKAMYQNNRNENKFIEKERNMEKRIRYCYTCGKPVDIDDCNTDSMWTNDGDRIVYHVCPYCGNSVEDTGSI